MLTARKVAKTYENGTQALRDINLTVNRGEVVYILGESGAGKTTFLKLLLGMEKPTAGELVLAGISLINPRPEEIRRLRRRTGAVFQDFKLILGRTARENVALSLRILGVGWATNKKQSEAALAAVGLADKMDNLVGTLSWGERQRVALARAVVRKPQLLLADEPTGNLDEVSVGYVAQMLTLAVEGGSTLIVATHDSRLIERLPGRILVLKEGSLTKEPASLRGQTACCDGGVE